MTALRVVFRRWTLLASAFCIASLHAGEFTARPSGPAESFAHPPADARILKIIHNWPDAAQAQDDLIRRLLNQGFGGVVCNVSFDQYLESEAKWQAFVRAVQHAKQAGMAMWLYDERGYPSGNAGGLVLRDHPEWEAEGLLVTKEEVRGGAADLTLPPGRLFLAAAYPRRGGEIDLAGKIDLAGQVRDGRLSSHTPAGEWELIVVTENRLYEGTHAEGNLHMKMPYVNLLRPEPTARFLELTHQRYAEHLGMDLGQYFMATFTDEPSLMSCFLRPMPYRPLPWGPNLPLEFKKRRGYALDTTVIPALVADGGPAGAKPRYDFWLTVGELVSENFFGQIQRWCESHHIPSGGHLLMEEGLVAHVPLYGDFFRCARRLDAPSIDCLTSIPGEVPWFIARLLASAAELEGRTLVMSETSDHSQVWRPAGDQRPKRVVTEEEIRGTCNRLMVAGVNSITSYYSFGGLTDESLRRLNEWVGRCCSMLRGGHQMADVALVYPVESIWTHFTPARHWANEAPAASQIENIYRAVNDELFRAQRDFTIVDSATLAGAGVEDGRLTHRNLSWRVIILPGVDTLPWAAWANLGRFVQQGGVLIALGSLPANSETDFPSPRVRALAREWFGSGTDARTVANEQGGAGVYLPSGSEGLLVPVLNRSLDPDVKVTPSRSPVRVTHRRLQNEEVYFLINDSAREWNGTVQFSAVQPLDQWDPASGQVLPDPVAPSLPIRLEPYGARLVRFSQAVPPAKRALRTGHLPNLARRPLPANSTPLLAHGEFVDAQFSLDPAHATDQQPAWTTRALLRKSQVDTFLFVRLLYPKGLDLSQADCLAFDSWIPDGQKTPAQLLLILHEKDGGDFLASTPRSLAAPGHVTTFVPLARFQLAGWAKDNDGELDLTRVDEIRIGWGGYLGTEGEQVEFSFTRPEAVIP